MRKLISGTNKYIGDDGYVYSESGKKYCRFIDNTGYYQSQFAENKKKKYFRIHRLMALAFIPNPEKLSSVNHIDGNKLNNELCNLEWVSNASNTKHAYDNGLYNSTYKCDVVAINKSTKERIAFRSVRSCSEALGLNRKTITTILKKQKKSNYEYDFEYKL